MAIRVMVLGLSGLLKAYRSTLSASGSLEISGASLWEDAFNNPKPVHKSNKASITFFMSIVLGCKKIRTESLIEFTLLTVAGLFSDLFFLSFDLFGQDLDPKSGDVF